MSSVEESCWILNVGKYYWNKVKEHANNPYLLITGLILSLFTARYGYICLSRSLSKYRIIGPVGLPFLGSALPFLRYPYDTLIEIGSCGKITTVQLGLNNNVFINDISLSKKIMSNKNINLYRPPFINSPYLLHFLALNGEEWRRRRQYFSNNLIGKINDSQYIFNNIVNTMNKDIIPNLDKIIKNDQLWYPKEYCSFIDLNLMFNGIFGMNLSLNNDSTGYTSKLLPIPQQWFVSITRVIILALYINFNIGSFIYNIFTRNHNKLEQDANNILINFMMEYGGFDIDLKNNLICRKEKNEKKYGYIDFLINETNMNATEIMSDVILAIIGGTNTASKALEYGLILLARNQIIQTQIYNELINYSDDDYINKINKLHKLRAFCYEVLRLSVVSPLGIPHYAIKDVIIDNIYYIPKGSIVHNNMYFIHKIHNNDNKIHLDYWLDDNKKFKMNNDIFMLFGQGQRSCPARQVAMKLLYYAFINLLIRYKFIKTTHNNNNNNNIEQIFATVPILKNDIGIKLEKRK